MDTKNRRGLVNGRRDSLELVIAFNAYRLWGDISLYSRLYTEIKSYFELKLPIIITHCRGEKSALFSCINFHPAGFIDYLLYNLYLNVQIIKYILYYTKYIKTVYFATGSILFPAIFMTKLFMGKRVYLAELGDWPSIIYYKLLFRWGVKIATLGKAFMKVMRKIIFGIVDYVVTNSPVVYNEMGGRISFRIQRRFVKCDSNKDRLYIVYLGRLDFEKGVLRLLEDAQRLFKLFRKPLLIAGTGPLRRIFENVNGKIIRYIGELHPDEVGKVLSEAYAVVIPSYTEGFPSVYIESRICGVPLIVMYRDNPLSKYIADVII